MSQDPPDSAPPPDSIDQLAAEILGYLRARPQASDSAEGIARWWIRRQRLEVALCDVRRALDRLVADSVLERLGTGTGRTRYALRDGAEIPAPEPGTGGGGD